jgi:hypothetical protein
MSKPTTLKQKSDKTAYIIVAIVGLLGVLLIGGWSTVQFGMIHGDEFSPDTFKRRTYTYYRIPLVHWQVTGIDYTDTTGSLEQHLKANKLVPISKPAKPTWHTIQASAGVRQLPVGDAAILYRYLDAATAPGGKEWLDWTTSQPKAAAVMWPVVAQLARDQLYLYLPELLELANKADNVATFTTELNAFAARSYTQVADARRDLGRHNEAVKLYQAAIGFQQDHAAAQQGLAESQAALKIQARSASK